MHAGLESNVPADYSPSEAAATSRAISAKRQADAITRIADLINADSANVAMFIADVAKRVKELVPDL